MTRVVIDVAEFIANPIRSGIQRVVRELLRHWPATTPAVIAGYDAEADALREVSPAILDALMSSDELEPEQVEELRASLASYAKMGRLLRSDGRRERILLPELFSDHRRCWHYQQVAARRPDALACIVYDFIALLSPEIVQLPRSSPFMRYVRVVEQAGRRAYISQAVRDDFNVRIGHGRREDRGPVIRLGSDGLAEAGPRAPRGPQLVAVGAFDGRKGQDVVYAAFTSARVPPEARLLFLGSAPRMTLPESFTPVLANTRQHVTLRHDPPDHELGRAVASARATLFVSTHEGFGLPAVESLYLGTPVVAHAGLPALSGLPASGQIRLPEVTVPALREAIERLFQPGVAERLQGEAAGLALPTWRDYAREVASWASG